MSGSGTPPPPGCGGDATPKQSGTFAMHGLPVDVLADGHALLFARARHYDLKHGRWLQRDPKGYVDGLNLYEAFRGNPVSYTDPFGNWAGYPAYQAIMDDAQKREPTEFERHFFNEIRNRTLGPLVDRSYERFLLMYQAQLAGDPLLKSDADVLLGGVLLGLGDFSPSGMFAEAATGISTGVYEEAGSSLGGYSRLGRGGLAAGETVLWGLFSTQGGQLVQGLLGRSPLVYGAEFTVLRATAGRMRLGLLSEELFLQQGGRMAFTTAVERGLAAGLAPNSRIAAWNARRAMKHMLVYDMYSTTARARASITIATALEGTSRWDQLLPESSLSARQLAIHRALPEQGATGLFRKRSVAMSDLRAIGRVTGDEYSVYTQGGRRFVIRGFGNEIKARASLVEDLVAGRYGRWSGHTHPPGYGIRASTFDRDLLQAIGQRRSAIWADEGFKLFGPTDVDDQIISTEIARKLWLRRFGAQQGY